MTTATALAHPLRATYLADAAVTGAVGLLALESPADWYGAPGWLVRAVGVVLLLTAVELVAMSRASGRVLKVGTTVFAELCFAWVAATVAVLALRDVPSEGVEVLGVAGLLTLGFGIAYVRLGRSLDRP